MTRRGRFDRLTPGVLPGRAQEGVTERLCEGRVLAVAPAGVTFSLPEFPAQKFGPAPWCSPVTQAGGSPSHAHSTAPQVGDRCLVGFAGADRQPWVIGWWPA